MCLLQFASCRTVLLYTYIEMWQCERNSIVIGLHHPGPSPKKFGPQSHHGRTWSEPTYLLHSLEEWLDLLRKGVKCACGKNFLSCKRLCSLVHWPRYTSDNQLQQTRKLLQNPTHDTSPAIRSNDPWSGPMSFWRTLVNIQTAHRAHVQLIGQLDDQGPKQPLQVLAKQRLQTLSMPKESGL